MAIAVKVVTGGALSRRTEGSPLVALKGHRPFAVVAVTWRRIPDAENLVVHPKRHPKDARRCRVSDRDAAHSINISQRPASAAALALRWPRDLACLNPSLQQNHPSPSPTPQSLYGSTVSVVAPFKGATQRDRQRPLPHRDSHHMVYLNAPARLMHIGRLQACLDVDRRLHHLHHRQHQDHRSSHKKCEPGNQSTCLGNKRFAKCTNEKRSRSSFFRSYTNADENVYILHLERDKRLELSTSTLARSRSTN